MRGFSLLEVLIAIFVLSVGLLSTEKLQIIALQRNYQAYLQSIAANQFGSLFDRLQAGILTKELLSWNQVNAELLPKGEGKYSNAKISVCWFDRFSKQTKCSSYQVM